jgi:enamine deaminase RidA (YjgF/YER057c/UK114 family)
VTIEHFVHPAGLPPTSGYSHAVAAEGRLVVVSGQLPLDAAGHLVGPSDPLAQARQVFANLGRALAAAGATPADLIRLGFYLTELQHLGDVRVARDEFLGIAEPPASSLVQVAGLVVPGALLEVEGLAVTASSAR